MPARAMLAKTTVATGTVVPYVALAVCLLVVPTAYAARVLEPTSEPHDPKPPAFPDTYKLEYTFSMPHFFETQPKGLSYPVQVWYDGPNNRRRVDVYDGMDSSLTFSDTEYTIYPRVDKLACDASKDALLQALNNNKVPSALPNLRNWFYAGTVDLDSQEAQIWQNQLKEHEKTSEYTFYTTSDGKPLKFHMLGINFLTDSHFDEYLYEFTQFSTDLGNSTGVWAVPDVCAAKVATQIAYRHSLSAQHEALLPQARAYDHSQAYHIWSRAHGRVHSGPKEYQQRLERFQQVAGQIQAHNQASSNNGDASYQLRVNQFADWSEEEFYAVMLPRRMKGAKPAVDKHGAYKPLGKFKSHKDRNELPRNVDWRGTGADPGVKDQGMCGSCYAFAATGSMEGTWYVATGQRRSFSEQQLLDCAWDWGPAGCDGGDYQPLFNYVAKVGGVALEQEYSYDSEDHFCRAANHTLVGQFDGFLEVEARDELSLMEAVYTFGPVAVAVDAGMESFRYYSSGVYADPACTTDAAKLDHAVTLFGYGTTHSGQDYWLVRNSWAKFYGDDGYIRIARGKHDCGISSAPAIAVVKQQHVVAGMRQAKQQEAVREG